MTTQAIAPAVQPRLKATQSVRNIALNRSDTLGIKTILGTEDLIVVEEAAVAVTTNGIDTEAMVETAAPMVISEILGGTPAPPP